MTTETAFSVRALAREVAAVSALTDPGALAKEVAKRIPDEHLRDACEEMLRQFVRGLISSGRVFAVPLPREQSQSKSRPPAGRPNSRSWKRDGIRAKWAQIMRERVHVGPAASDWKFFGDCGVPDLDFMAAEREQIAEANHGKAREYVKVRTLLIEHNVTLVRELPESALDVAFGGAE